MTGRIRVGIGGWVFEPWRGTFYPEGLRQKDELAYVGEHLTATEINATYYSTQKLTARKSPRLSQAGPRPCPTASNLR